VVCVCMYVCMYVEDIIFSSKHLLVIISVLFLSRIANVNRIQCLWSFTMNARIYLYIHEYIHAYI
jgi:hypothetical protein